MATTVGELAVIFGLQPRGWEQGEKLIKRLSSVARQYIGVQAVRSISDLVGHVTEGATHLVSYSKAIGLTVQQTQLWGYVSEQSGSNLRELSVGFGMAERNLQAFASGKGGIAFRQAMAATHTSIEDARNALASPDGMNAWLLKVSDTFQKMGDTAKRGAIGQAIFGARAGRAVVADMARGPKAIEEMMKRREQMGLLDEKQAMSLRDLGNRMKDLKTSFGALAQTVIAQLAPTFIKMADAAVKWISANKDLIGGALVGALKIVAGLFSVIAGAVSLVSDVIHRAFAGDGVAQAALVGLASVIAAVVIPAIYSMVAGLAAAAAAATPMIVIFTAIGLAALDIVKHWDGIKKAGVDAAKFVWREWQAFGDWFVGLGDRAIEKITEFADWIMDKVGEAIDWVEDKFESFVKKIPGATWLIRHFGPEREQREQRESNARAASDASRGAGPLNMAQAYANAYNASLGKSAVTNNNYNVTNNFKVDGAQNPTATAEKVEDHLDASLRNASRGVGGGVR